MSGRALVFSHPEIVQLASTAFVPYAGDQWYLHRQQDEAGRFFWQVAQQGHNRHRPLDETRQGIYFAAADGHLFGSINSRSAERTLALMKSALEQFRARQAPAVAIAERAADDPTYARRPPEGGLIVRTFTRIPLPRPEGEPWRPNDALGRDHMWLTRAEWRSLLPAEWRAGHTYPVPPAVAYRIARFHLTDNVRGEPPMWTREQVKSLAMTLTVADPAAGRLALQGTVRLAAPADGWGSERGFDARLQGIVAVDRAQERIVRFDLLAWGEFWGEGRYTRGAPPGRFPLLIAFQLAPDRPMHRVPPQGSRGLREYFATAESAR